MRVTFIFISSLLFVIACDKNTTDNSAYPASGVDMQLHQVSEHTYYVKGEAGVATDNEGFISNAGFIVTDDGVVVFDALGTPSLAHMLLTKIRSVTNKPVVKVIVSHYHADHIYGLQVFKEQGARIIAPKGAMEYLGSPSASERLEERKFSLDPWVNETTKLIIPDEIISKPVTYELGGLRFTLDVLGAAHSEGDLTMYVEPDNVLFSGDIIFEGRIPYLGDANTKTWLDTLKKMEVSQLAALIPGHGPAAKHPAQAITATRQYLEKIRNEMGSAVINMDDFATVYNNVDWGDFKNLPAFEEANRRNAYQVYLSMEEELRDK